MSASDHVSASRRMWSVYLILQWIFLSSAIILFNKHLLSAQHFHFPITLVMLHMLFISIAARLWRVAGWTENPVIMWRDVATRFLPIALLFAASLGLGNAAYLYISVAFIQMLKASTPVAVLLTSFVIGLESPSARLFVYIAAIGTGVAISAFGQMDFNIVGFSLQLAAVVAEALRLCLVNVALTGNGLKFPPLTFLSIVAPLCFGVLLPAWLVLEAKEVSRHSFASFRHVGYFTLLANSSVAFLLNLATMALIKHTSALTLNVSGVFKDLLLIGYSVVVSGAVVTSLQYGGYAIALTGVIAYTRYKNSKAPPAPMRTASQQPISPAGGGTETKDEEAEPLAGQENGERQQQRQQ